MNAPAIRLGRWHQAYLYSMGMVLVLSGILWLVFHYFVRIEGEFGPTLHPLEPWWLRMHGIAAAAFLIGFGSVLPGHVRRAWGAARNRMTGTIFFAVMVTLILSGYFLYYVGSDAVRDVMALAHWVVGLALPFFTVWHVWRGRVWRQLKLAEQRASNVVVSVPENQLADSRIRHRAGGARS
ncbi:MAG: hypothetical protein JSW48_11770 [Betaproteobacteria bacterium]|nr:MAG: hypothetical protein JSW48_11770 [Betaproteobacteria bacterium]